MTKTYDWTPTRVAKLRDLWATGLSTAKIGDVLGCNKNCVIGKAHRLDLPSRKLHPALERFQRQVAAKPKPPAQPAFLRVTVPVQAKMLGPREIIPDFVPTPTPRIPPALRLPIPGSSSPHRTCQWPISAGRPWVFCGCATVPGFSWCAEHRGKVFERKAA